MRFNTRTQTNSLYNERSICNLISTNNDSEWSSSSESGWSSSSSEWSSSSESEWSSSDTGDALFAQTRNRNNALFTKPDSSIPPYSNNEALSEFSEANNIRRRRRTRHRRKSTRRRTHPKNKAQPCPLGAHWHNAEYDSSQNEWVAQNQQGNVEITMDANNITTLEVFINGKSSLFERPAREVVAFVNAISTTTNKEVYRSGTKTRLQTLIDTDLQNEQALSNLIQYLASTIENNQPISYQQICQLELDSLAYKNGTYDRRSQLESVILDVIATIDDSISHSEEQMQDGAKYNPLDMKHSQNFLSESAWAGATAAVFSLMDACILIGETMRDYYNGKTNSAQIAQSILDHMGDSNFDRAMGLTGTAKDTLNITVGINMFSYWCRSKEVVELAGASIAAPILSLPMGIYEAFKGTSQIMQSGKQSGRLIFLNQLINKELKKAGISSLGPKLGYKTTPQNPSVDESRCHAIIHMNEKNLTMFNDAFVQAFSGMTTSASAAVLLAAETGAVAGTVSSGVAAGGACAAAAMAVPVIGWCLVGIGALTGVAYLGYKGFKRYRNTTCNKALGFFCNGIATVGDHRRLDISLWLRASAIEFLMNNSASENDRIKCVLAMLVASAFFTPFDNGDTFTSIENIKLAAKKVIELGTSNLMDLFKEAKFGG